MKLFIAASLGLALLGASQVNAAPQSTSFHNQTYKVYCFDMEGPLWNSSAYGERSKDRLVSQCTKDGGWSIVTIDGAITLD
ncbi:hypothetical protein [Pseudoalteromonas ulvae]|uniref:Uncharacterized protein n=1 Tax=Pseudoalteromonas ulvae TaxID=107327 RepID=A0A244CMC6_PSEDV|nr:hypothetical protein [Pseudoalteromonas ulvae]OUL56735.1 hypothetical protein B1199_15275 [Pseudoalteromonas ulvae]